MARQGAGNLLLQGRVRAETCAAKSMIMILMRRIMEEPGKNPLPHIEEMAITTIMRMR